MERKKREQRTVTAEKRNLGNRTREGGSKGGTVATALEDEDL